MPTPRSKPKPTDSPRRAIGYIRVSSVGGRAGAEYHTLEIQRASIERVCEQRGYELVDILTDENRSGKSRKRPRFTEAMDRTMSGEADAIAVWKVSRFSRNWSEAAADTEQLLDAGKDLISGEEGFDTTTTGGRALLRMLFVLAAWEHEVLGEGWEVMKAKAVKERGSYLGVAPLGYSSGAGGVLVPDEMAPVVTELFERRAAGQNWSQLATYLDEVKPRAAGRRDRKDVERIITNRTYLGEVRWRDEVHEGAHTALVTEDQFNAAGATLEPVRVPVNRSPTRAFPLSGWLRCSGCGGPMGGSMDRGRNGEQVPNYKCSRRRGGCDAPQSISAKAAEAWAMAAADARFTSTGLQSNSGAADVTAQRELEDIIEAIEEIRSAKAKRDLGEDWLPTMVALNAERKEVERKVGREHPDSRIPWADIKPKDRWRALRNRAPLGAGVSAVVRRGGPPAERLGFIVDDDEGDAVFG